MKKAVMLWGIFILFFLLILTIFAPDPRNFFPEDTQKTANVTQVA
jgi:hypothetical protein